MLAGFVMVLLVLAAAYVIFQLASGFRIYLKLRGKRLITCPETNKAAAVEVAAGTVAKEALFGRPHVQLGECSRWPERQNCGQDCLRQVEAAQEDCLVWTIVSEWYEGRKCVYCHKLFGKLKWHDHKPALIGADRKTVPWDQIPAERLPEALETYWPVCWNCHIAEAFRQEHPDLVGDPPLKH